MSCFTLTTAIGALLVSCQSEAYGEPIIHTHTAYFSPSVVFTPWYMYRSSHPFTQSHCTFIIYIYLSCGHTLYDVFVLFPTLSDFLQNNHLILCQIFQIGITNQKMYDPFVHIFFFGAKTQNTIVHNKQRQGTNANLLLIVPLNILCIYVLLCQFFQPNMEFIVEPLLMV